MYHVIHMKFSFSLLLAVHVLYTSSAFTVNRGCGCELIVQRSISISHNDAGLTETTYCKPLQMSFASPPPIEEQDQLDIDTNIGIEANEYQETKDLIIDFVGRVAEIPVGSLEEEDLDFIVPVLNELLSFSESGTVFDSDDVHIAEFIDIIVLRLVDEWQEAIINDYDIPFDFKPDISIFNSAIMAWNRVNSRNIHAMVNQRVIGIYKVATELYGSGLESCQPTVETFNEILETIAFYKSKESGDAASEQFDRMIEFGISPNARSYKLLIDVIAKNRDKKDSASQADEFLRQAILRFPAKEASGDDIIPIESFNSVLAAWAKADERTASSKIESILSLMHGYGLKPNMQSFTIYIDSFAQRNDWDSVQESDYILTRLVDMFLANELDFEPDVIAWTSVIRGWMRLSRKRFSAAVKAENVMERMIVLQDDGKISVKADSIVYCSVLNAYCYAGKMDDAQRILSTMEYLWKQGDEDMKPSARTYKILIEGWVKSDSDSAMIQVEELMAKIKPLCEEENEEGLLGDIYKSLIFGYAKRGSASKAEDMLRIMVEKGYKVDAFCFDKVIDSYNRALEVQDIKKVYGIFELMESCQKQGMLQANERLYTSLIRAITNENKPGVAKRAQTIVKRMIQLYDNGNKSVLPSIFTYNAVMKACAKSALLDDAEKASSFSIAIATFNKIRGSDGGPDHVTYSNLMKCSQLLPEGEKRNNFIKATFSQCSKNEMVNVHFLDIVEESAPKELFRMLTRSLNTN